jgi:hypothetical protein
MVAADYAVIVALVGVACAPLIYKGYLLWAGHKGSVGTPSRNWEQDWVQTLMRLQSELAGKQDQSKATELVKGLIWELIGGGEKPK